MNNKATNIRWRILSILIFASFVSYVLRANLSIAAPAMIADLHISELQWGWVLAAFTAGYALFQVPGGMLGDRFGPRRVLTAIAVLWALLTVLTSLIPDSSSASVGMLLAALITVRFLVGATHAPIFPVVNCSVERWFPAGNWAFPTGLSSTGLTLGFAAAAPLLAWMVVQWGWRTSFIMMAPLGLLSAWLWWWYARDEPAEHSAVNQAEIELIQTGLLPDQEQNAAIRDSDSDHAGSWKQVLKNRNILFLTLSYSCMNFVFYDVFNWFYLYLVSDIGFDPLEAGALTSYQWIAGAAGAALGGWMCDGLCKRLGLRWGCRFPIVAGMAISGVLLVAGAFTESAYLTVTLLALCFFFNQLTEGAYWAASMAIGGRHAGTAGGVMNTGANLMGIVNALLVPVILGLFGWTVAIAMGGFFALTGAGLMLLVRADQPFNKCLNDTAEPFSKGL